MADESVWERMKRRPLESYSKTWLGFIAVAVVAVLIAIMLLVHALGAGYRHYTAEFLQAASLRAGNPIVVAGIPVGNVTSMKLVGDHVEAGLKIRDNIALGKDSRAQIKVTPSWVRATWRWNPPARRTCPTTPSTWRTPRSPTTCKRRCRTPPPRSSRSTPTGSHSRSRCSASSSRGCPRLSPRPFRISTPCPQSSRYDATNWDSCCAAPSR